MRFFVVSACIIGLAIGCTAPKEETKSTTFSYEQKTIRTESTGGCASQIFPCANFEVSYPEFNQLSETVKEVLTERMHQAIAYDDPESDGYSFQDMADGFVEDFEHFQNEFPDNHFSWYFKSRYDILINSDTLLSLSATSEYFTGGAHGGRSVYFINIDPMTGKEVDLNTLLKPGFDEVLAIEGEKSFRKVRGLDSQINLAEAGFEFPEGKFTVNTNYGFTADGIVFFFNAYEIAPFSSGTTEIMIPWKILSVFQK
jgi:hypothetical protein